MDWGGIGASLGGSLISGLFGQASARDAAENSRRNMELQHQYNMYDYQHRYQWSTEDMRKAGLNPILAATHGIAGSINGTGLAQAPMAPIPDFASAINSANQISSNREIARMQNEVAKEDLRLKEIDVVSAKDKRENDVIIEKGRFQLEKYVQEAAVKRADALNDATIQNMKDRLEAEKAHWERADMNGAAMAAAAIQSANAAGLQAAVAEKLGISREAVNQAEQAYIGLQSENAEENLKWQRWLNDHPYTRGAVGFLGAMFDTVGLGVKAVSTANFLGNVPLGGD